MTTPATPAARLLGVEVPLAEAYDLALLDLDGVVYIGPDAVPGAGPALQRAKADGMRLCYVTNNASRPAPAVADHLRELGVPAADDEVMTSAMAAASLLARRLPEAAPVLVVGGEGLSWALRGAGLRPVGSIEEAGGAPAAVVQGFHPDVGWRLLAEGTRAIRAGAPWVATNTDLTVPTAFGPAPGNGTLVAAVAAAAGVEPEVAGKPQPTLFLEAVRRYEAQRPLVIGDRLDTDLEGARAARIPGLLVMTGVTDTAGLLAAEPVRRPDLVCEDLSGLHEPHRQATAEPGADAATIVGRCGQAVVTCGPVAGSPQDLDVVVTTAGGCAVELLRAAAVAAWTASDVGGRRLRHRIVDLELELARLRS